MFNRRLVLQRILETIGRQELEHIRPQVGSGTLRRALRLMVDANVGRASLFIPHYWALYYHDGRSGFSAPGNRKLIFFADPKDDPRGPTPERQRDQRRLTREQYKAGLERNATNYRLGLPPFMLVVDASGPTPPRPFFDDAASGAARRMGPEIARIFDAEIQAWIDSDPAVRSEKKTARLRMRGPRLPKP